jgi:hypothetical protein
MRLIQQNTLVKVYQVVDILLISWQLDLEMLVERVAVGLLQLEFEFTPVTDERKV